MRQRILLVIISKLIVLISFVSVQGVDADEEKIKSYSMEESIRDALANNWSIKAKKEKIEVAVFAKEQAKADFYPKSWYEAEVNASLERIKTELELALKIIDHHPIDLLLLDGTLIPHISDRPSALSPLSTKYHEIKTLHSKLFEQTKEKAILLAGIVKDSRSNRKLLGELMPHLIKKYPELKPLLQMDYRFVVNSSYDTDLFFRILDVGERSAIFRFKNQGGKSNAQNMTPAVMEGEKIVGFYLRTAKYDYPLRVEVYTGDYDPITTVNKVSAMLVPMSSDNEELALPAVLIDVDSQARLFERDLDFMFHQLAQRIGFPSNLLKLRRERMPFH